MLRADKCEDCIHNEVCLYSPLFTEYSTRGFEQMKELEEKQCNYKFATLFKCNCFQKDPFIEAIENWEYMKENDEYEDANIPLG